MNHRWILLGNIEAKKRYQFLGHCKKKRKEKKSEVLEVFLEVQ
jgi:hypothetical protein